MKVKFKIVFYILLVFSCNSESTSLISIEDNKEVKLLYEQDQSDRKVDEIDWSVVGENDINRRKRIEELLDSNMVLTSNDYHNAAMIFQHGRDSSSYGMAVKMMRKSIELDSTANKWLLAAAIDRYLLSKDEKQIYGTQYEMSGPKDQPWQLRKLDTTKISDEERVKFGVETLAEQRENVKRMNRKKLFQLFVEEKSIEEILDVIKSQNINEPDYDISERAINSFGYKLINQAKHEEALKILRFNTEMYPTGFNTWDSYGECLINLNMIDKAITAYKKSLQLNPDNQNAIEVIEKYGKK